MAATSLDRNTLKKGPIRQIVLPMATGAVIPIGVMVAVATPSAGAVNAIEAANMVVMGLSCQAANQTLGDTKIVVERGIFCMANNGNITAAHVGQPAFVIDNQTVGLAADTATADIIAGYITEVTGDGVWVDMTQAKIAAA
jgi:hypothetical protein